MHIVVHKVLVLNVVLNVFYVLLVRRGSASLVDPIDTIQRLHSKSGPFHLESLLPDPYLSTAGL
jgi:hypothetical protein